MAPESTKQDAQVNTETKQAEKAAEATNTAAASASAPAADSAAAPEVTAEAGRTVLVTRPHDGGTLTLEASPGGQMNLGFDPSAATASRDGNDLVFDIDGSGKVVLKDFFVVGDESLPNLRLPDGTVVASADFFNGSDLDMSTAAGPGAGQSAPTAQAPGSGGTNYSDGAGDLIGGVDKYGKLGTFYWGRESEIEEEYEGIWDPRGDFSVSIVGEDGSTAAFGAYVSEDAKPTQHVDGEKVAPIVAARLMFDFNTVGTTEVTGIHFSNFPAGMKLFLGDPANGGQEILPENGVYNLTLAQFQTGIYIIPPANSHEDFDITVVVDFTNGGVTVPSEPGSFTVVVDAVADLPLDVKAVLDVVSDHSMDIDTSRFHEVYDKNTDGFIESQLGVTQEVKGGAVDVSIYVKAQFTDAVDGSEGHFILVQKVDGLNLVTGAEDAYVKNIKGVDYWVIRLNENEIDDKGWTNKKVEFTTDDTNKDTQYHVKAGAMTVEEQAGKNGDREMDLDNNVAHVTVDLDYVVKVDTVSSDLNVNVGWASEGHDPDKHGMNTTSNAKGNRDDGTSEQGAPINFDLSKNSANSAKGDADDYFTKLTVSIDKVSKGLGSLQINPDAIDPTWTVEFGKNNQSVTITFPKGSDISKLDDVIFFVPKKGSYSDDDVSISYEAHVANDEGSSVKFTGKSTVVVDAVADMPDHLNVTGEWDRTFVDTADTKGKETVELTDDNKDGFLDNTHEIFSKTEADGVQGSVTITVSATFADRDGSENHYMLVQYDSRFEPNIEDGRSFKVITLDGVKYWQFEVTPADYGKGGKVVLDIDFVTTKDITADTTVTLQTGAMAVETVTDSKTEYRTDNNKSVNLIESDEDFVSITIDMVNSGLKVSTGWASEGNDAYKHVADGKDDFGDETFAAANTDGKGAPVNFTLAGENGSAEFFTNLTVTLGTNADGKLVIDGAGLYGDGAITFTTSRVGDTLTIKYADGTIITAKFDTDDQSVTLTFPKAAEVDTIKGGIWYEPSSDSFSDKDVAVHYDVNVANKEGSTAHFSGDTTVVVDAVADLPVDLSAHGEWKRTEGGTGITDGYKTDTREEHDGEGGNKVDGFLDNKHTIFATGEEGSAGLTGKATVTVSATFPDHVDGSESHFILVQCDKNFRPDPDSLAGKRLVVDENGDPVLITKGTNSYWQFRVEKGDYDDDGKVTLKLDLIAEGITADIKEVTLDTGALAIEGEKDTTTEYRDANNEALTFIPTDEPHAKVEIDMVNAGLKISVGWASEGNDAHKHVEGTDTFKGANEGNITGATGSKGAPVDFVLDYTGTKAEGTQDFFTSIKVSVSGSEGTLQISPEKLYDDKSPVDKQEVDGNRLTITYKDGTVITVDYLDGGKTLLVTFPDGSDVSSIKGGIWYTPNDSSISDQDVPLHYEVSLANEAGSTAHFSGDSTVVVDAVADLPKDVASTGDWLRDTMVLSDVKNSLEGVADDTFGRDTGGTEADGFIDSSHGRFVEGGKATVEVPFSVTATFPDMDGSEDHFVLIQFKPGLILCDKDGNLLDPGAAANFKTIDGVKYWKIAVDDADLVKNTDGTFKVNVLFTAEVTGDTDFGTIKTGALAVEKTATNPSGDEYREQNNEAFAPGDSHVINVDVIDGKVTLQTGWAYEGNNGNKHVPDGTTVSESDMKFTGEQNEHGATKANGAPIIFKYDGKGDDYISEIVITFEKTPSGELLIDPSLNYVKTGNSYTITVPKGTDVSNLITYKPTPGSYDDSDVQFEYSVTVKNDTTKVSDSFGGKSTIAIDAVANLPINLGTNENWTDETTIDFVDVDKTTEGYGSKTALGKDAAQYKGRAQHDETGNGFMTNTHEYNVEEPTTITGSITLSASFPDHADGSETHYILLEYTTDIIPTFPAGYTVTTDTIDGVKYWHVQLPENYSYGPNGEAQITVTYETSADHKTNADFYLSLKSGGKAVETDHVGNNANDEYRLDNNTAVAINTTPTEIEYDVVNSGLTVNVGWASEGNNDAKHVGGTSTNDYTSSWKAGAGTLVDGKTNVGAPVNFSLDKNTSAASSELSNDVFDTITVTVPASAEGALAFNAAAIFPGVTLGTPVVEGNVTSIYDASGKLLLTVTTVSNGTTKGFTLDFTDDGAVSSITDGIYFVPTDGSKSFADVDVSYSVEVKNAAGSSVTYDGKQTVIIDAVADQASITGTENTADYNGDQSAAKPTEMVELDFKVTFPDATGKEDHFILIQKVTGVDYSTGTIKITDNLGNVIFEGPFSSLEAATSAGKIASALSSGNYYKIPVFGNVGEVNVVMTVSNTATDIASSSSTGDKTYTIKVAAMAAVDGSDLNSGANGEHDINNNVAITNGNVKFTVSGVASSVTGATLGNSYENADMNAHEGYVSRGAIDKLVGLDKSALTDAERAELTNRYGDKTDAEWAKDVFDTLKDSSAKVTVDMSFKDKLNATKHSGEGLQNAVIAIDFKDASNVDTNVGQFLFGDKFIPLDGTPVSFTHMIGKVAYTFTLKSVVDADTGRVVLVMTNTTANGDPIPENVFGDKLYFVPGENYNSNDLELEYSVYFKDNDSGHVKAYTTDDASTDSNHLLDNYVKVDGKSPAQTTDTSNDSVTNKHDAVAQATDIEDCKVAGQSNDKTDNTEYTKGIPGKEVDIKASITLHGDVSDGTEGHTFYVMPEDSTGYQVTSVTFTYTPVDGSLGTITITVPSSDFGLAPGKFGQVIGGESSPNYHTVNIEDAIKAWLTSKGIPQSDWEKYQIDPADTTLDFVITVQTPNVDNGHTTIYMGVQAHEDKHAVLENGDGEYRWDNNTAWSGDKVELDLSSSKTPALDLSGFVYENNYGNANTDNTAQYGSGIDLGFTLGDDTDQLINFNVSLNSGSAGLGTLYFFGEGQYDLFCDWVAANPGVDPMTVINNYATAIPGNSLSIPSGEAGYNSFVNTYLGGDKYATELNGNLVFMPSNNSYSGKDPVVDVSITVKDKDSGHSSTLTTGETIAADTVAQIPHGALADEDAEGKNIDGYGGKREVTLTAKFDDLDDTTDHYFLIKAESGWTIEILDASGKVIHTIDASSLLVEYKGDSYFKIPADYLTWSKSDHTGLTSDTASVTINLVAPKTQLALRTSGSDYDLTVYAVSEDSRAVEGTEVDPNNNIAYREMGSLTGKVVIDDGPGHYVFEQTTPLYEDNQPNSHIGDDTPQGGTFRVGGDIYANGGSVTIKVPLDGSDPKLLITLPEGSDATISGPDAAGNYTITFGDSGYTDINVELSPEYIANHPHDATDLNFDSVTFTTAGGDASSVPNGGLTVVVDAVADLADVTNKGIRYDETQNADDILKDTIVGGGADSSAKFTVDAYFPDHDGSETCYVLVEYSPVWDLANKPAGTDVYYQTTTDKDGNETVKAYWRIPVTPDADGKVSYEVELEYKVGAHGDNGVYDSTTGATDYIFETGAMTIDKAMGANDQEIDLHNNISVSLDNEIKLTYSPVDSTLKVSVNPSSATEEQFGKIGVDFSETTLGLSDVANHLVVTYGPASAGSMYLVGDGTHQLIASGTTITDPAILKKIIDGEYKLEFEQSEYNSKDVTISWDLSVTDKISGATETLHGGKTVIVDAKAQGTNEDAFAAADVGVSSEESAQVTVHAEFTAVGKGSEEHWVVLQQTNEQYHTGQMVKVTNTVTGEVKDLPVTTIFSKDGTPYYGVQVPSDWKSVDVVFEVTTPKSESDTNHPLKVGTIVVETTKDTDGDRETSFQNNWVEDLNQTVTIYTGVLETQGSDVGLNSPSVGEDGYIALSIPGLSTITDGKHEEVISYKIDGLNGKGTLHILNSDGTYSDVTPGADGILSSDALDALLKGELLFKPVDDMNGTVDLTGSAKVRDIHSGEESDWLQGEKATVTVIADADDTELTTEADVAAYVPVDGHKAEFTHTFNATFLGATELCYLVFSELPDGVVPTTIKVAGESGAILTLTEGNFTLAGSGGQYYVVIDRSLLGGADSSEVSLDVTFTATGTGNSADANLTGNIKAYTASVEPSNNDAEVSDTVSVAVDIPQATMNQATTVVDTPVDSIELEGVISSTVGSVDNIFSDGDASEDNRGFDVTVGNDGKGTFGTLSVEADGDLVYTLNTDRTEGDVLTINSGSSDTFSLSATDGFDTVSQDFTINFDSNYMVGTAGDDTFGATTGSEVMYGGSGNDTFSWAQEDMGGRDTIADFTLGDDKISFHDIIDTGTKSLDAFFVKDPIPGVGEEPGQEGSGKIEWNAETKTLVMDNDEGVRLEAQFTDEELILNLKSVGESDSVEQTVMVSSNANFAYDTSTLDQVSATEIMENIIKTAGNS